MGQPRLRHRRGEGHARARSQRLRSRRAPSSAVHQRDGRPRPHQRRRRARMRASIATSRARKSSHDLEEQGLLAGVKDHTNNVGHCDRCKTVVEPRLSTQWFSVKIQPLAEHPWRAHRRRQAGCERQQGHPLHAGEVREDLPRLDGRTSTTGASRGSSGGAIAFPRGTAPPATRSRCAASTIPRPARTAAQKQITQETDVLDTWFSSGLLPVSVFGWPNTMPGRARRQP